LDQISVDSNFQSLHSTTSLGYAIRDSCSDVAVERKIAYEFNKVALAHANNKSNPKPVDIVLSSFNLESIKVLHLLNFESIPQISYSKDNAKLMQVSNYDKLAVESLISVYPENTVAIEVVVALIKELQFQYIYSVISDDFQGKEASNLLSSSLNTTTTCQKIFTLTEDTIPKVINEIKKNAKIRVIVAHCSKNIEEKFYQSLLDNDLNNFIILSTQDWSKDESSLWPFNAVLQGMIYIKQENHIGKFEEYMKSISRPYESRPWVKELYKYQGGTDACIAATTNTSSTKKCFKAEIEVQMELSKQAPTSLFSYEAGFTIANGLLKGGNLLEAVNGLEMIIPFIKNKKISFSNYLIAEGTKFLLRNIQKDKSQSVHVGSWEKRPNSGALRLIRSEIKWKNDTKETPESMCSESCLLGSYRESINPPLKCCWRCKKCPENTFTNATNADKCLKGEAGYVVKPDQTGFVKYELIKFKWFGSLGSFLIFLIVLACCFILLALGIISQNSDHELIRQSGYNLLCLYLIGCLLLALAPIPLLVTPTTSSCNGYIVVFNVALTIIFAVMMSRTSYINGFYDEDGKIF